MNKAALISDGNWHRSNAHNSVRDHNKLILAISKFVIKLEKLLPELVGILSTTM